MADIITKSISGNVEFAFSLVDKFIEVCPEGLWGKTFGGWPVWQQLYHPFASVDFFLRPAGAPEAASPFEAGVADLKQVASKAPEKAVVSELVAKAQAAVRAYVAGLDDAALEQKHEGSSSRMGRDMSHAAVIALIGSHTMYHLGACDAALREQGLPGVF